MKTPKVNALRNALFGVAMVLPIASALAAAAGATEIVAEFSDASTDVAVAAWSFDAATVSPAVLLVADDTQSSDEMTNSAGHVESEACLPGVSNLASWLPAAAGIPSGDAPLFDAFVVAFAALHSTDTSHAVRDTYWELQDLEGSTRSLESRTPDANLRENNSFVAAEVAFVLGNVAAPEPDVIFLAFVFLQSLWGLACRPRQA